MANIGIRHMTATDHRLIGKLEEAVENNSKAIDGLSLSVKEFKDAITEAWEKLAERVSEIEIKLRIGRALALFVLLLAMLAGYGIKDAIEAFLAVAKP